MKRPHHLVAFVVPIALVSWPGGGQPITTGGTGVPGVEGRPGRQPGESETGIRDEAFSTGKTSFSVRFRGETSPYRVLGVYVLPDDTLALEALAADPRSSFAARTIGGTLSSTAPRRWRFTAPRPPGVYPVEIVRETPPDTMTLNVFVMVPLASVQDGSLNGYRIGSYPSKPLKGLPIYKPPAGFVEVTPENRRTLIAPHFTLEQFLCKQEGGWPKYVVLRERLLLKLEAILEEVNRRGHRAGTLAILSGYRTPYYNQAIGNVRYSRHVWGGAADIYIDESPRDGMMDDLNGDGHIDLRDAAVLYELIDDMYGQPWYTAFLGGLGRYRRTSNHGPFVHADVRGFRARWGT